LGGIGLHPAFFAFLSAELYIVLARHDAIETLARKAEQRTAFQQKEVDRGLLRSVLLEAILFVPTSVTLVLLVVLPLMATRSWFPSSAGNLQDGMYALLGVGSYGFPFSTVRHLVSRIALRTLTQFVSIVHDEALHAKPAAN
jgi:hypothetical protein